ncbi:aldo/keto reductase [Aidingimonas lacisalsi]|uniref:aldo/keto reductase n=1 Tax=Aidingimonas lacisalsi TaxID=2604086 RepID=UPI0011D1D1F8|nr:aldo/keto reductase [Aidingimonas lacisalsi]
MTVSTHPTVRLTATSQLPAVDLPVVGQGTWYMGEGLAPERDEIQALQQGLDLGLTLIDTAEMYGNGGAETVVGKALENRRDDAFLVSKVFPWNAGRDSTMTACERSLERLGTDYLDLYLLHWPGSIPLEETLEAFERLQTQGKIGRFGVSNFDVDDMQRLAALPGGGNCAINQVLYHLGSRGIEHSLRPWQRDHGMPVMAYCPLAQGGRLGQDLLNDTAIVTLARERDLTPAQLLLAWATRPIDGQRDVVAIPKAVGSQHVSDNASALGIELDSDAIAQLDSWYPAPTAKTSLDIV